MKETETIFEEMKNELERSTGATVSSGGEMALRLYAVAAELSTLWAQVDWTREQSFPQTASGDTLDLHAAARGLTRAAATASAGSAGNVPAGSVSFFSLAPVGVARCGNAHAFTGGADQEDDVSLRQRVLASYESLPNGSNRAYYEAAALDTEGVGAVSVLPRARGIGTVDVIVASSAGLPTEETVAAVQAKFEKQREICVDVTVAAPTTVSVPVTAAVSVDDGRDFDTVAAGVKAAVEGFFDGKLLGKSILVAKLSSLVFAVDGVANCSITLPAADVSVAYNQLPVAGTVTVTGR